MTAVAHPDRELREIAVQAAHDHVDPVGPLVLVVCRGKLCGHVDVGVQVGIVEIPLVVQQVIAVQYRIYRHFPDTLAGHMEKKLLLHPVPVDADQVLQRMAVCPGIHQATEQCDGLFQQRVGDAREGRRKAGSDFIQVGH